MLNKIGITEVKTLLKYIYEWCTITRDANENDIAIPTCKPISCKHHVPYWFDGKQLTGKQSLSTSTGCKKGMASGSCMHILSSDGRKAWYNSSCLKTANKQGSKPLTMKRFMHLKWIHKLLHPYLIEASECL